MKNMVKVLLVPVRGKCFTQTVEGSFEAYRKIVPGWDEDTMLEACYPIEYILSALKCTDFCVYLDENGMVEEPKFLDDEWMALHGENHRASMLLGHNNSGMGHWGGALVGGPPDEDGNETSVPELLIAALSKYSIWEIDVKEAV